MKIRLRGQSVRLRLGRSEVATLGGGNAVAESIVLAPGRSLVGILRPGGAKLTLTFDDARLIVTVPADRLRAWATTDAVGIDETLPVGDGLSLRLLIEKDYACVDADPAESQADAFPNPAAVCAPAATTVAEGQT